ncbi:MAG TPA: peptide chain release factor 2 [Nevskiales bacterium]|nr:peptide chain release factor 2 [Nevskiales bacterium]
MSEIKQIRNKLDALTARFAALRGYLEYDQRKERLAEINAELENPAVWNNPTRAQELGREKARLEGLLTPLDDASRTLAESGELLDLAEAEADAAMAKDIEQGLERLDGMAAELEFRRMFSGPMDANNAYFDIQAGTGGTEAQDWAEMLLRMYLRFCADKGFKTELLECSGGEVAGIKSASVYVQGPYAYGWLRTETGVHRLVRKSPFDSNARRHTSFAAMFVSPEVDDNIEITINPADLRVDTYRSSGAGGQHVNKTDSAVRITHAPSGIVVACQTERSQHQNRDRAMKMLKARLYELELEKRNAEKRKMEASKSDIEWGYQIRSYVLDQSRIKDLRTGVEVGDTQRVLDGDLTRFIEASLKQGVA